MGLWLPFDPSVWMSHSTGHVVQTEEAPFAVAGHPVMLPNVAWVVAHLVVRFRIFPVTTDAGIHQCHSKIHLKTMSPHVLVHMPLPFVVVLRRVMVDGDLRIKKVGAVLRIIQNTRVLLLTYFEHPFTVA